MWVPIVRRCVFHFKDSTQNSLCELFDVSPFFAVRNITSHAAGKVKNDPQFKTNHFATMNSIASSAMNLPHGTPYSSINEDMREENNFSNGLGEGARRTSRILQHHSKPETTSAPLLLRLLWTNNLEHQNLGSSWMCSRGGDRDRTPRLVIAPQRAQRQQDTTTSEVVENALAMLDNQEISYKRSLYKRSDLSAFQNDVLRDDTRLFLDALGSDEDDDDVSLISTDCDEDLDDGIAALYP